MKPARKNELICLLSVVSGALLIILWTFHEATLVEKTILGILILGSIGLQTIAKADRSCRAMLDLLLKVCLFFFAALFAAGQHPASTGSIASIAATALFFLSLLQRKQRSTPPQEENRHDL